MKALPNTSHSDYWVKIVSCKFLGKEYTKERIIERIEMKQLYNHLFEVII